MTHHSSSDHPSSGHSSAQHLFSLIRRGGAFTLVLLALLVLGSVAFERLVLHDKIQYRTEQEWQQVIAGERLDILFPGASHTWQDVNPALVPGSFNLALGSNTFIEQHFKVRRALEEEGVRPRFIVLELDTESFSTAQLEGQPLRQDSWYYRSFVPLRELAEASNQSLPQAFIQAWLPLVGQGMTLFVPRSHTSTYRGWANVSVDFSLDPDEGNIRNFQDRFYRGQERIDPLILEHYEALLDLARTYNCTVVLVRYPYTDIYDRMLAERGVASDVYYQELFGRTAAHLDAFYVLDYRTAYADRHSLFADAHHLNADGAALLSVSLADRLADIEAGRLAPYPAVSTG